MHLGRKKKLKSGFYLCTCFFTEITRFEIVCVTNDLYQEARNPEFSRYCKQSVEYCSASNARNDCCPFLMMHMLHSAMLVQWNRWRPLSLRLSFEVLCIIMYIVLGLYTYTVLHSPYTLHATLCTCTISIFRKPNKYGWTHSQSWLRNRFKGYL